MKKSVVIILAVVAVAVVALLLVLFLPKTIVIDDYIEISVNGYDGYATASISIDKDAIFEKVAKKADSQTLLYGRIYDVVDVDLDKYNELSNGDVIQLELDVDEAYFESLGYKIKLKKNIYTVTDLPEAKTLNPFKHLEITYEGYDPYVRPILTNTAEDSSIASNISFYTDTYYVSEGDEFTVQASVNKDLFFDKGYVVETENKTYTATDIPQPEEINLFELLTVSFSGVDGKGKINQTVDESNAAYEKLNVHFYFNKSSYLKTGDTVVCTVSYTYEPEKLGYKVTNEKEMSITVPQLGKYASDITLVNDELVDKLEAVALEKAKEYFTSGNLSGYLYTSKSLFGKSYKLSSYTTFENIKITHMYGLNTTFGFVMTVDVGGNSDESANCTAYFYVCFEDLVINADGQLAEGWEELASCYKNLYNSYDLLIYKHYSSYNYVIKEI